MSTSLQEQRQYSFLASNSAHSEITNNTEKGERALEQNCPATCSESLRLDKMIDNAGSGAVISTAARANSCDEQQPHHRLNSVGSLSSSESSDLYRLDSISTSNGSLNNTDTTNSSSSNSNLGGSLSFFMTPQSNSIKNHLRRKSIPNPHLIEQHISNIISQNQAIVDNFNPWSTKKTYSPRDSKLHSSTNNNHDNNNHGEQQHVTETPRSSVPRKRWSTTNPPYYSSLAGSYCDTTAPRADRGDTHSSSTYMNRGVNRSDRQVRSPKRRASVGIPSAMHQSTLANQSTPLANQASAESSRLESALLGHHSIGLMSHSASVDEGAARHQQHHHQHQHPHRDSEPAIPFSFGCHELTKRQSEQYSNSTQMSSSLMTPSHDLTKSSNSFLDSMDSVSRDYSSGSSLGSATQHHQQNLRSADHRSSLDANSLGFQSINPHPGHFVFGLSSHNNNNTSEHNHSSSDYHLLLSKSNPSSLDRTMSQTSVSQLQHQHHHPLSSGGSTAVTSSVDTNNSNSNSNSSSFLDLLDVRQAEQLRQIGLQAQASALLRSGALGGLLNVVDPTAAAASLLTAANLYAATSAAGAGQALNINSSQAMPMAWDPLTAEWNRALFHNFLAPSTTTQQQHQQSQLISPAQQLSCLGHSLAAAAAQQHHSVLTPPHSLASLSDSSINGIVNDHVRSSCDPSKHINTLCNCNNLSQQLITSDQRMRANQELEETLIREFLAKMQSDAGQRVANLNQCEQSSSLSSNTTATTVRENYQASQQQQAQQQQQDCRNDTTTLPTPFECRNCRIAFTSYETRMLHESYCYFTHNLTAAAAVATTPSTNLSDHSQQQQQHLNAVNNSSTSSIIRQRSTMLSACSSDDEASCGGHDSSATTPVSPRMSKSDSECSSRRVSVTTIASDSNHLNDTLFSTHIHQQTQRPVSILKQQLLAQSAAAGSDGATGSDNSGAIPTTTSGNT
ncbi:hypothetical protein GZH46_01386, partial [Fragariocoptes setiger]